MAVDVVGVRGEKRGCEVKREVVRLMSRRRGLAGKVGVSNHVRGLDFRWLVSVLFLRAW